MIARRIISVFLFALGAGLLVLAFIPVSSWPIATDQEGLGIISPPVGMFLCGLVTILVGLAVFQKPKPDSDGTRMVAI